MRNIYVLQTFDISKLARIDGKTKAMYVASVHIISTISLVHILSKSWEPLQKVQEMKSFDHNFETILGHGQRYKTMTVDTHRFHYRCPLYRRFVLIRYGFTSLEVHNLEIACQ